MTRLSDVRSWPATALRFARSTEPRETLAGWAVALDVLLALAAAMASLAIVMAGAEGTGPAAARAPLTSAVLASVLATTVPLALRRVFPVAVFWLILAGIVVDSQASNFITFVALMLAAYSAVVHSRFRGAALISVPLAAVMVTVAYPDTSIPQSGRFTALFLLIPVVLVGNAVHRWRHKAGHTQEQLRRAEAEHAAATTRALAAERSRIAGELHDVVTHNVSVMVVQAGAARRILSRSPEDAKAALLAVEASGRTAMVELQHMLGLLSPVEGMRPPPGSAGPDPALLHPQPGLTELPALVDRVAAAGLPVELTVTGQARQLPAGLGLTAYRIVQEALTNVMKHAGPTAAVVVLDYRADGLVIDVTDDGGPGQQPGHEAGQVGARPGPMAGSGRGLLGLRERVCLYGGELDARPRPGGGWRVIARLPDSTLPADAADAGSAAPAPLGAAVALP
jgi:signal transduction histidine kinase